MGLVGAGCVRVVIVLLLLIRRVERKNRKAWMIQRLFVNRKIHGQLSK